MAQEALEPFEIIVVDNNSSDKTVEIVRQICPEAIILKEEKAGTSAARQRGFKEAKGDILIFLDADVKLPDNKWLAKILKTINQPLVVAASSHYRYYGIIWHLKILQTIGTFVFVYPWIFLTNNLLKHSCHMIGGLMAIKKQALIQAGGFGGETEFFGDETLIAKRLYRLGKIIVSPKLWVWTSGRRFKKQGLIRTVFGYVFNYFWALFMDRPYRRGDYQEFR